MLRPKKNSHKEFDNEKQFLRLENSPPSPPPLHNFSNGPSLSQANVQTRPFRFGNMCTYTPISIKVASVNNVS